MATTQVGSVIFKIAADTASISSQLRTLEGNFNQSFQGISRSAATMGRNLLSAFGVGLSVGAITSFTKSVVDMAGKLTDLSEQTGISAQLLSGMKSTLEEAGTSADSFARGIFSAQRRLGQITSETDQAALAAKRLGLDLNELRNASTERFLEMVAGALSRVENRTQKAADGAALLGRQYQELAPALQQVTGRFEELRRQGISEADLKLLDEAGDAWTRLVNRVQIAAAGFFAETVRIVGNIRRLIALQGVLKSSAGSGATIGALSGFGSADIGTAMDAALKPIQKDPFKAIVNDAERKKLLAELKRIEAEGFKGLIESIEAMDEKTAKAGAGMVEVFAQLNQMSLTPTERAIEEINARFDELLVKAGDFAAATGQGILPVVDQLNFFRRQQILAAQPPAWTEGFDVVGNEPIEPAQKPDLSQLEEDWRRVESVIRLGASGIHNSFLAVGLGTKTLSQAFSELGTSVAASIAQMAFEVLVLQPLLESLKKSFLDVGAAAQGIGGSGGGGIGGLIATGIGLLASLFHEGGAIPGGGKQKYIKLHGGGDVPVLAQSGEFMMQRSAVASIGVENLGYMNKTGQMPGGNNFVVNIDARGAERGVHRDIERMMERKKFEAVNLAVSAVQDTKRRSHSYASSFGR